jgi:hypothetical protein
MRKSEEEGGDIQIKENNAFDLLEEHLDMSNDATKFQISNFKL